MDFGLLRTAGIATRAFVPAIGRTDHTLLAVASRNGDRARAFASEHGLGRAYGSYRELLSD